MQQDCFNFSPAQVTAPCVPENIVLADARLIYWPSWVAATQAQIWWEQLRQALPWQQSAIQVYGRRVMQPRLSCWVADPGVAYTYSKTRHEPQAWLEPLIQIKQSLEAHCQLRFNSVLGNYYRDGQDGLSWHSDNEPELGEQPWIASMSFGHARRFVLRRRDQHQLKHSIHLAHGSLLLMGGTTQQYWQHALPKTTQACSGRINLTFRWIHA